MTEETIRLNREDLKDLKEKGFITRERIANVSKTKRWKPKKGESYWYVADHGRCVLTTSHCSELDEERFEYSNVYQTEEEAQKELDRRFAEQELVSRCDFDGRIELCYDEHAECFEADDSSELPYYHSPYRFATKKSCQKAIDILGPEKLKLIFRID